MKYFRLKNLAFFLVFVSFANAKEYDFQRFFSKKWRVNPNEVIVLESPVGEIHITNTAPELGPFVIIKQRIYASFDELAKSRQMVMMVRVAESRRQDSLLLITQFPVHMFERYRYPNMGGFFTSQVEGVWQGKQISISPKKGVKLWSDIYIEIPANHKIAVKSLASTFVIEDFHGDIEFVTKHASAMTAGDIEGDLFLTACHGALSVSKFTGNLYYYGEDSDISFCDVVKGKVSAESVSGDIIWNAKCDSVEIVEIISLSGKIMFDGEPAKYTKLANDEGNILIEPTAYIGDSLIVSTIGGDIKLEMPENYASEISATTEEGKIKHNLPTEGEKQIKASIKGNKGIITLNSKRGTIVIDMNKAK